MGAQGQYHKSGNHVIHQSPIISGKYTGLSNLCTQRGGTASISLALLAVVSYYYSIPQMPYRAYGNIIFKIGLNCMKRCNVPSKRVTVLFQGGGEVFIKCLGQGLMAIGKLHHLVYCVRIKLSLPASLYINDEPRVMISQSDSFKNKCASCCELIYIMKALLFIWFEKRLWCCQLCQLSSR